MSQNKKPCKNHPDRLASRRCYFCKEHICSACRKLFSGHFFCGKWCYYRWTWKTFWNRLPLSFETRIVLTLIILSNIIVWLLFNNLSTQLTQLTRDTSDAKLQKNPDSFYFSLDTVRQRIPNQLKISISANPGLLIGITQNSRFNTNYITNDDETKEILQFLKPGENVFKILATDKQGQTTLLDSFNLNFNAPRFEYLQKPLTMVKTDSKLVALTFDGGSLRRGAEEILAILEGENVQSTIFLTGKFIKRNADLVKRMLNSKHEIGNHTYDHPHLTTLEIDGLSETRDEVDRHFIYRQLNSADSILYSVANRRMLPLWRAPYGEINDEILTWAAEQGYKHIGWSYRCDALDWVADTTNSLYRTDEEILSHFLDLEEKRGLQGRVILMHLGTERQKHFPYTILGRLISELRARGYSFGKVSELLKLKNKKIRPESPPA